MDHEGKAPCRVKQAQEGSNFRRGVLGSLAEFERELIHARTSEGRARAMARGVKMGPKPKLTPHQMKEAIQRRERGDETLREIARSYDVSHSTISRLAI
jgi:DNA invertase Pin-like site-specific DNA recombinase